MPSSIWRRPASLRALYSTFTAKTANPMTKRILDITDRDTLISAIEGGFKPKYLFFWGHRGSERQPGPHVLSQWWPAPFDVDGVTYATAEHFMMAEKARLFGDTGALERVLASRSPGAAKAAGRAVANFDEALWSAPPVRYRGPRQPGEVQPERRPQSLSGRDRR
ncbi:MAG: NADAR family protein [Hyphomicrobiaceae bacterium]